jgi:hypothetical protein
MCRIDRDIPCLVTYERENPGVEPRGDNLSYVTFFCHWLSVSVDELNIPVVWEDVIGVSFLAGACQDALFPVSVLAMNPAVEK